jgi:thiol-disulfide isomerase/thioredoxin
MIQSYQEKYLKYKQKYLNLKNSLVFKSQMNGGGRITQTISVAKKYSRNFNMRGGGNTSPKKLILFKAEWCNHCQAFKKTWEQVQKELKRDNLEFVTLDSEKDEKIIKKYDIKGFPTLILEIGDKKIEFQGMRNVEAIKNFLKEN